MPIAPKLTGHNKLACAWPSGTEKWEMSSRVNRRARHSRPRAHVKRLDKALGRQIDPVTLNLTTEFIPRSVLKVAR